MKWQECLIAWFNTLQTCSVTTTSLSCLSSVWKVHGKPLTNHHGVSGAWDIFHPVSVLLIHKTPTSRGQKGRTFARKWTWRLWLDSKTRDWSTQRDLKSRAPPREPPPSSRSVGPMFHWTSQLIECCPIGCFTVNLNSNNAFWRTRIGFLGKHPKQKFQNNSDLVWLFLDNPGSREPVYYRIFRSKFYNFVFF